MRKKISLSVVRVALGVALGVALTACSGTSTVGVVKSDQACADLAKARCTESSTCAPLQYQTRFADEATCEAREQATCLSSLAAPSTGKSQSVVEDCATAYGSWMCPDYLAGRTPQACLAKIGALAAGAACGFSAQCESAYCGMAPNTACGVCAAAPKAGDSCANLSSCGESLVCHKATCTLPAPQGQPCDDATTPCVGGESCVGSSPMTKGTCQAAVATAGAPCDATRAKGPDCSRSLSLYCAGSQCAAITFATPGQPCGSNVNGAVVACAASAFCTPTGFCVGAAADGAECNVMTGPSCGYPARCVVLAGTSGGTCQAPSAADCK